MTDKDALMIGIKLCQKKALLTLSDMMEEYHYNQIAGSLTDFDKAYIIHSHDEISTKLQIIFDYLYKIETGAVKLERILQDEQHENPAGLLPGRPSRDKKERGFFQMIRRAWKKAGRFIPAA